MIIIEKLAETLIFYVSFLFSNEAIQNSHVLFWGGIVEQSEHPEKNHCPLRISLDADTKIVLHKGPVSANKFGCILFTLIVDSGSHS